MTVSERYRADYRELRHGAGAVTVARDVLVITGADAASFLQGQLSQDVAALEPGDSALSLLLQPDGKLHCLLRVSQLTAEQFVCDLAPGLGEGALARLERFKLRVAVDIEVRRFAMLAVRGAAAPPPPAPVSGTGDGAGGTPGRDGAGSDGGDGPVVLAPVSWGTLTGWDLVAAGVSPPGGVRPCGPEALEALRIEAGVPAAGRELTEGLIPAETGIVAESVSFTKGCFVGQELVARIDSRGGNTPRRLRGVVVGDAVPPAAGAALLDAGGSTVGRITSSAFSPSFESAIALGYVHRRVDVPAPARIGGDDGRPCEIRALPLVP